MKLNFAIVCSIILLLAIPLTFALTGSLDNARMILRVDIPEGQMAVIHKSLKVNNVNDVAIKVEFEPDYGLDSITTFYNKSLYLLPGESAESQFDINLLSAGNYSGKVLIRFIVADPSQKSPPVGLASSVTVIASGTINNYYQDYRTHVEIGKNASPKLPPPPPNVSRDVLPENPDRENGTATIGIGSRLPQNYTSGNNNNDQTNNGNGASSAINANGNTNAGKNGKKPSTASSVDTILLVGIGVILLLILVLGTLFVLIAKKKKSIKPKKRE